MNDRQREALSGFFENGVSTEQAIKRVIEAANPAGKEAEPTPINTLEAFTEWWDKPMFREGLDERQVAYMAFYFGRDIQGRIEKARAIAANAATPTNRQKGQPEGLEELRELISEAKSYTDRHNLMEEDFLYIVGLMRRAALSAKQ